MNKVEQIINTKQITIEQIDQIKKGNFTPDEPAAKKVKTLEQSDELKNKIKLSSLIANPIGKIKSPYLTKSGTPRQPGLVNTISTIELFQGETGKGIVQSWMPKDALDGVDQYSHCWIIFHFHLNDPGSNGRKSKVAPPRGNGKKVGIFASRAPYRPSPIGLTLAQIERVDVDTGKVYVKNCDLVNETPILDIKPYIPEYDVPEDKEIKIAKWLEEKEEKTDITGVGFTPRALADVDRLWNTELNSFQSVNQFKEALVKVLQNDPRSIYRKGQQNKGENKLFYLNFASLTITVWFDNDYAEVLKLEPFYDHTT